MKPLSKSMWIIKLTLCINYGKDRSKRNFIMKKFVSLAALLVSMSAFAGELPVGAGVPNIGPRPVLPTGELVCEARDLSGFAVPNAPVQVLRADIAQGAI